MAHAGVPRLRAQSGVGACDSGRAASVALRLLTVLADGRREPSHRCSTVLKVLIRRSRHSHVYSVMPSRTTANGLSDGHAFRSFSGSMTTP